MMLVQKVLECCDDYDIVHSHIGELALLAGKASSTPWVHTWHNALTEDSRVLMTNSLQDHFSISNSHRVNGVDYRGTVYNGIRLSDYGVGNGRREYLAFLGRFSPEKGPDKAIEYAKAVNVPLVMAGKIGEQDREFFESDVRPHIDGDFISYIGEVNLEEKNRLLGNALALLFLINWSEPFGLVMIESMACGTPVIALKKGAVPEVVIDGKTGIFGDCLPELIARFSEISDISASACRKHVENNFSAQAMCDSYLWHYREILGHTVL
jgi:glycosyltransferase involved in cell wall biosynthesis